MSSSILFTFFKFKKLRIPSEAYIKNFFGFVSRDGTFTGDIYFQIFEALSRLVLSRFFKTFLVQALNRFSLVYFSF